MRFKSKTIAITGGTSGIGLGAAKAFAKEGGAVYVAGRSATAFQTDMDQQNIHPIHADVTQPESLADFFETIKISEGKLDVLFANAGIAEFLPLDATDTAHFRRVMEVNFFGVLNTIKEALPIMSAGSSIILTTSIANQMGEPNSAAYSASKAAAKSLVSTLSTELAPRSIRVNAVSPGPTETPIFAKMGLEGEAFDQVKEAVSASVPMRRMAQVTDVVPSVLYLASEESQFVMGQELVVDGGVTGCPRL